MLALSVTDWECKETVKNRAKLSEFTHACGVTEAEKRGPMTEKDMPDVIYLHPEAAKSASFTRQMYGNDHPYIRRSIVTADAAKSALDALDYVGSKKDDLFRFNAYSGTYIDRYGETIRALLLAHAGAE